MDTKRLIWTDDLKLGLPAMDADHRDLLDMCNQFLDAAQSGAAVPQLAALLSTLILRTKAHFRAEEVMLDRHQYPALAIHRSEHERLVSEAEILLSRFRDDSRQADIENAVMDTATFLQTWLVEHIRKNDKPYRPFMMRLV